MTAPETPLAARVADKRAQFEAEGLPIVPTPELARQVLEMLKPGSGR